MTTSKKITFSTRKSVDEIEKGTILKGRGDLFIVSEVVREHKEDQIHDTLFLTHPPQQFYRNTEAKYQLTSFSTGGNYFEESNTLAGLLRQIDEDGRFEVVNSIEFVEKN